MSGVPPAFFRPATHRQLRQRRLARGVWYRLRRVLTEAETAWLIPADVAAELRQRGLQPVAVGGELDPPKEIFLLGHAQQALVAERGRPTRVGLPAELLGARHVALVRFP